MTRDIVVYGVAISIIFGFVRWAVPAMPKSIAWCGVAAGVIVLLVDLLVPEMKPSIPAILLFLAGALLIGLSIHVSLQSSRLANVSNENAKLGSLTFEEPFVARLSRNITTGQTNAELVVNLKNNNDFLLGFRAAIGGSVNGAVFQTNAGEARLNFEGFVSANKSVALILRIPNVPSAPPGANSLMTTGSFTYDVTYFPAQSKTQTRRTAKEIAFEGRNILANAPGQSGTSIHVMFSNEREE